MKTPKRADTAKDRLDQLLPALGRRVAPEGVIPLNHGAFTLEAMRSHPVTKQRDAEREKLRAE